MANKWLLSTAVLTMAFIIIVGVMEICGIVSFSSSIMQIENFDVEQRHHIDDISIDKSSTISNIISRNDNDYHSQLKDCDFLIYQCAVGNDWEIRDMFKWSHPWILTVRDYAKVNGYCYKFDIFDKMQVMNYLNENHYHWSQQKSILVKTFGVYCMEYAILKYSPKWLLFLDIDVAIPPKTFYHRTLKSILNDIQREYSIDPQRFYNDITFIGQDLQWTLNSGIVFLNNNHNDWHKTHKEEKNDDHYDIMEHWNDTTGYKYYSEILMSPKLQQFFDRIKSSLHHREYSIFFGYDQVILQDVILFYANLAFLKQNRTINSIVNEYLFNKSKHDNEYLFYDKKCLQYKIVREHNNCYWNNLNSWGYPFGERQFDPIILVSQHKYRMNMHNNYEDNDIFLHNRKGEARKQAIKWLYQYNMSLDKVWEKLP